jgi:hypothetical protein
MGWNYLNATLDREKRVTWVNIKILEKIFKIIFLENQSNNGDF